MGKIENSKDLILLLLYARGSEGKLCEPISGQTRLMKMIFLFKKELYQQFKHGTIAETAFPDFEAYDYGPYSAQVYEDLEFLVNVGMVEVVEDGNTAVSEEEKGEFEYWSVTRADDLAGTPLGRTFKLTSMGKQFVEQELLKGRNEISTDQLAIIAEFKARCVRATLRSLLQYVYSKYGDMTTKSKIRDQILNG